MEEVRSGEERVGWAETGLTRWVVLLSRNRMAVVEVMNRLRWREEVFIEVGIELWGKSGVGVGIGYRGHKQKVGRKGLHCVHTGSSESATDMRTV